MFLIYMMSIVFISMNKEKIGMWILGTCALVNIVLNYLWIPQYSYVGASYATIISEVIYLILFVYYIKKFGYMFNFFQYIWKAVVACIVMAVFIMLVIDLMNIILVIFASAVIYGIVLLICRALDEYDKELIRKVIHK